VVGCTQPKVPQAVALNLPARKFRPRLPALGQRTFTSRLGSVREYVLKTVEQVTGSHQLNIRQQKMPSLSQKMKSFTTELNF
jgi:hypothetical protein